MLPWQQPVSVLFNPDASEAAARPILEVALPLLSALRSDALMILKRCTDEPGGEDHLAVMLLYRHFVEMLDAFLVLIVAVAPAPARLQLRSMFEALLGLEYIGDTKTSATRAQKSYSYLICEQQRRLSALKLDDPNTPEGRRFRARLSKDRAAMTIDVPNFPNPQPRIEARLKIIHSDPHWKDAEQAYQLARKANRNNPPNWHALYNGPRSISALSELTGRATHYDLLYGPWSTTMHAVDFDALVKTADEQGLGFAPLRNPTQLRDVVDIAVGFTLAASRQELALIRPTEDQKLRAAWYIREIRPLWDRLTGDRLSKAHGNPDF